jgi:NADPH-dependent 2,4-dienoyl-CoA reductase/sulfur reductase-like enzyme/rhodanese-related sulfurtransferase
MRTVIVGGVAGGMSAATRLRRLDERHEIVVFERSRHVSYANCGLPYHLGGVIEERASLILNTPHRFAERFAIDVRTGTEVVSIDRARQVVTAEELATGRRYETPWDHLVLSPGAAPIVPDVPGVERAHTLRTVEDMDKIVSAVREREAASAVVVGAGFIGLEAAENLSRAGLGVNVVELALQVLAPLDPELAQLVAEELTKQGVGLSLGSALAKVLPDSVELTDGRVLPGDLVVLAMGVRPETALALSAGLEVGTRGGIRVDERLRTSDPRIYAVGDAVEKTDQLSGEAVLVPLANIANRQGRIVADDIAGTPRPFQHVQGSAIIKVFREVAAVTGWNEKRLKDAGRPYIAIHIHAGSHAGYYPGGATMALKLLVDPGAGTILGAEAVGRDGVDKRMDVLATAVHAGMAAPELIDLELCYAPQFASAKDPVNILGYVAENRLNGNERAVQWHELANHVAKGAIVVDVRGPGEHARGHIPGSVNFPLDDLRARREELAALAPSGTEVIVYCLLGLRAHIASRLLSSWGCDVANLDGGYLTWSAGTRAQDGAQARRYSATQTRR